MQAPATLNGYPVIQSRVHESCVTIMVERSDMITPFVVATWWPALGDSWSWGHYEYCRPDALEMFEEVAGRNRRRRA